jgi:hypothetical protein
MMIDSDEKGQLIMPRIYESLSNKTEIEPKTEIPKPPAPIESASFVPADDGFADAAAEASSNLLRGSHLKFVDWHYYLGGSETPLATEGLQLLAVGTAAAWQRWEGGKVVDPDTIVRKPGKPMPDREELGFLDKSLWEKDARGEAMDPWANTRFLYLVNPRTAELITLTTKSWGGRSAVFDLSGQIERMRSFRGPNVRPLIELGAAPMPTKFGPKSKPFFHVIRWYGGDSGAPEKITNGGEQVKLVEEPTLQEEMQDQIPF